MSQNVFTPAMGRFAPTRIYDSVVALTRERLWRALAAMYAAPQRADVIVDVGCGTGSFALLLAKVQPGAEIIAVDPAKVGATWSILSGADRLDTVVYCVWSCTSASTSASTSSTAHHSASFRPST